MIKFLCKKISNFQKDKQAVSAPAFAIFALTAITTVTTGIDVNRYIQIRAALQSFADQSVLGAARLAKADQIKECKALFQNKINHYDLKSNITSHKENCNHGGSNGRDITIVANAKVKTYFSSAIGLGEIELEVTATSGGQEKPVEVVYAISTQGTMCSTSTRTASATVGGDNLVSLTADPSCEKFTMTKDSLIESIGQLSSRFDPTELKIGIVPYSYKVKFPNITNIPPSLTAIENEVDFFSEFTNEEPLPAITPLASDNSGYNNLINQLNAITLTPNLQAWGRSDLGIHTSALMLDPSQKGFFDNHDVGNWDTSKKYVILMADGKNIGCCYTNHPGGNYENQYIYSYEPYNQHMTTVCDALKAKGVKIFTILFDVDLKDTGGDVINNAMARCASGDYAVPADEADPAKLLECKKKYSCYDIDVKEDLDNAFAEITGEITKAKIDQ